MTAQQIIDLRRQQRFDVDITLTEQYQKFEIQYRLACNLFQDESTVPNYDNMVRIRKQWKDWVRQEREKIGNT